jgi:hypothetical protein
MFRNLMPLLSALALLVAPAIAHAEEPTKSYPDCGREPTDAEVAAAKGAFQAGNASFNEADYTRAIDYWEDAYRRDCTANPLLLNLARAYELAGRKRQAVVSLETFLAREPGTGEKDQINRRIDVLKKKIAEEDAAAAAAPPPPTGPAPAATPPTAPAEAPADSHARRSPWPWVVMGVGAVTTTVGILAYRGAKNKADDIASHCDVPGNRMTCSAELTAQGNEQNDKMKVDSVIAGVGAAAIVGGAVWWFLDWRSANAATQNQALTRPRVLPLVAPQLAGIGVVGKF